VFFCARSLDEWPPGEYLEDVTSDATNKEPGMKITTTYGDLRNGDIAYVQGHRFIVRDLRIEGDAIRFNGDCADADDHIKGTGYDGGAYGALPGVSIVVEREPSEVTREVIEERLNFAVRVTDGATGALEWEGEALDLLRANENGEGDEATVLADLLELADLPAGGRVLSGFSHMTRIADGDWAPSNDADIIENIDFDGEAVSTEYDDGAGLDAADGIDDDLNDWNRGA